MELYAENTEDVVHFQVVFWMAHFWLRETTDLTVQDVGMHHADIVCDIVAGL